MENPTKKGSLHINNPSWPAADMIEVTLSIEVKEGGS